MTGDAGYNTEILTASIEEFRFPDGSYWAAARS